MTQLERSSRRSSGRQSGRSSRRSSARCGSRDVVLEIGSRDVMRAVAYHGEIGTFAVIQPVGIALRDQSWQWYILGLGDRREGLWSQPADFGVFARLRARRARWRGRSQGVHSWHSVNSSGLREVIREAIREVIREAIREGITLSPAAVGESARSTRAADGDPASHPYAHTN